MSESTPLADSVQEKRVYPTTPLTACLLLGYLTGSFAGFVSGYLALQLSEKVVMDDANQTLGVVMFFGLCGGGLGLVLGLIYRLLSTWMRQTSPVVMGFTLFTLVGLALALTSGDQRFTTILLTVAPFSFSGSLFGLGATRAQGT